MLLKLSKLGVMEKAEASSYTYVLVGVGGWGGGQSFTSVLLSPIVAFPTSLILT